VFGAVWLCRGPLLQIAIFVQLGEDVLGNVGLMLGRGPSEVIELDLKPIVDLFVQLVVLVTQLLRGHALLDRLGLGGRPVFVRTTDI
jgi:hypothetical protein